MNKVVPSLRMPGLMEREAMPRKSRLDLKTPSRRKETAFSEAKVSTSDFWQTKTVEELAVEQGVKPIENPDDLVGDFWPEDESIDDFLVWLREIRREQKGIN